MKSLKFLAALMAAAGLTMSYGAFADATKEKKNETAAAATAKKADEKKAMAEDKKAMAKDKKELAKAETEEEEKSMKEKSMKKKKDK